MLLAIVNAKVVPVEGAEFEGTILVRDGRIAELGADVVVPDGAEVLDVDGAQVTPGLIDAHVHLGVHPEGDGSAASDTNEMTNPNTAGVRTIDAIDPFDEGFDLALAGGVTTVNVNPGSGTPIRHHRSDGPPRSPNAVTPLPYGGTRSGGRPGRQSRTREDQT